MKMLDNAISSHYGMSMDPDYMVRWARWVVKDIRKLLKAGKYPVLIYRGMSGVSTATALAMHMDYDDGENFGMIYVRKEDENSHGGSIERSLLSARGREIAWIFCDDFICKGTTALEVIQSVSHKYDADIALNDVWFALSMGTEFYEACKLNKLNKALVTRRQYGDGNKIARDMRKKHRAFITKEQKRRAEYQKYREESDAALFASFPSVDMDSKS